MVDLQGFQRAAQDNPGASLVWRARDLNVSARSGPFSRWTGHVHLVENRRARGLFLQAINRRYGAEIARNIATTRGLTGGLRSVKPLTSRKVQEVVQTADRMQSATNEYNLRQSQCVRKIEPQGYYQESVSTEIKAAVAAYVRDNPTIARKVDSEAVAQKVEQAVMEAGRNGRHLIDAGEARAIRREIVQEQVALACGDYFVAKARALNALDIHRQGSLTFQALAAGFASFAPPLEYGKDSLTPDAAEELHRRIGDAVNSGEIGADQLDDLEALRALANVEVGRFIVERDAARAAVAALQTTGEERKQALLVRVSRDNIPASLVARAANHSLQLGDKLAGLSNRWSAEELEGLVTDIRRAVVSTWRTSGDRVDETNEELHYRWVWRMVLASLGEREAKAVLRQLAPGDSPLRAIGEAAAWYGDEFRKQVQDLPAAKRIYSDRSFDRASETFRALQWLWATLQENTDLDDGDGGSMLTANGRPDDQTIASLRNLGIPFPAPGRLRESNAAVPISRPALAVMREEFEDRVRNSGTLLNLGVTSTFMEFLLANEQTNNRFKARFSIDGRFLPPDTDARAVVRALKNFCTNPDGQVDEALLAQVSRVLNHETLGCMYAGCMNPKLPNLAILNGYPEGVYEGHSYSLWKNDEGDVEVSIEERITPLYFHPFGRNAILRGEYDRARRAAGSPRVVLSGSRSDFRAQVTVNFNAEGYEPVIDQAKIGYTLVPGDPERGYWLGPFDESETETDSTFETTSESASDSMFESTSEFEDQTRHVGLPLIQVETDN